jgi:hypothetical protein
VALREADGAAQEADRGAGLLVRQDLGVSQPGGVVDGDVHAFPARLAPDAHGGVGVGAGVVRGAAEDPLAGAALDAPELLDDPRGLSGQRFGNASQARERGRGGAARRRGVDDQRLAGEGRDVERFVLELQPAHPGMV